MSLKVINAAILAALQLVFNKAFKDGLGMASSDWKKVATEVKSSGAVNLYGWLNKIPKMREWIGSRQLNRLKTSGYSLTNKLFEDSVGVLRTDLEDDNAGMYTPTFAALGEAANEHIDESIFALLKEGESVLCHDGQPFFDTDHPIYAVNGEVESVMGTQSNLAGGDSEPWYLLAAGGVIKPLIYQNRLEAKLTSQTEEGSENVFMRDEYYFGVRARRAFGVTFPQLAYKSRMPLTAENLEAARVAMSNMKTDNGRKLGVKPTLLVVPSTLGATARKLVKADTIDGTTNTNKDVVEVLETTWVD